MNDPEIVIGTLASPDQISTRQGQVNIKDWDFRAIWSALRLQFTRSIDSKIKAYVREQSPLVYDRDYVNLTKEEKTQLVMAFFESRMAGLTKPREMQFIVYDDEVRAVASLKHLLVPPKSVYAMAKQIINTKFPDTLILSEQDGLTGLTYEIPEFADTTFHLGLQLYGGDIFTRRAISLSSWLRVIQCFNPLSWLGSGSLNSFTGNGRDSHERMLRIKVINELKPRLIQAIELQMEKTHALQKRVDLAKKVKVSRSDQEIILSALSLSYKLGGKTINQVLDRLQQEDPTLWGMGMASSWVASHGDLKSSNRNTEVVQKLSTISGATILLNDVPKVKEKSIEWLKSHIKDEGATLNDLAKRLKLMEKQQP